MAAKTSNELEFDQIQLAECLFLDCIIQNDPNSSVEPSQIAEFSNPVVILRPSFTLDPPRITFAVMIGTSALGSDGEQLGVSGSFRLHMSFAVNNLSKLLQTVPGTKHKIPQHHLSLTLASTAYATARGMILSKVSDTILQGFALPLRSVQSLLEDSNKAIREAMSAEEIEKKTSKADSSDTKPKKKS